MSPPERRDDVVITGAGAGSPLGVGARALRERAAGHGSADASHVRGRELGGHNATLPVEAL